MRSRGRYREAFDGALVWVYRPSAGGLSDRRTARYRGHTAGTEGVMPKITFTPEGVEPKSWEFTFGRIMSPERAVIEKMAGGMSWDEVQQAFWKNSTAVVHAVLYVLLKREKPDLRPIEVEFCDDDYTLEPTRIELEDWIATAEKLPELRNDPDMQAEIASLREQLDEAPEVPKASTNVTDTNI